MCTREEFARLRDVTRDNAKAITELQKADAVQSEQIKTLFKAATRQSEDIKAQSDSQAKLVNRLVMAILGVLVILVLAVVFGALGEKGFNGVTKAAPNLISAGASHAE